MILLRCIENSKNKRHLVEKQISCAHLVNPLQIFPRLKDQFVFTDLNGFRCEKWRINASITICNRLGKRSFAAIKRK